MSLSWGKNFEDSLRIHEGKQGAGSVSSITGGQPPAALSQNPLTDGRLGAEQPLIVHANGRPAYDWKALGWFLFGIFTAALVWADVIIAWNIGKVISK